MKRLPYGLVAVIALSVVILAGTGCSQKAAEKLTEKALEDSAGGDADVDLSGDTLTINSNGSSYQVGGTVSLPSNFPDDVYLPDGTLTSALTSTGENTYWISMTTSTSAANVSAAYQRELVAKGWTMNLTADYGGFISLGAEKGTRTLAVMISEADGETSVIVSESTSAQ